MSTEAYAYAEITLLGNEASLRPLKEFIKENINDKHCVKISSLCNMTIEECKKYCEHYYDDYEFIVKDIHPEKISLDFDFFYTNLDFITLCSMLRNSLSKEIYIAAINQIHWSRCGSIDVGRGYEVFDPERRLFNMDKFILMYDSNIDHPMISEFFSTEEEKQKIIASNKHKLDSDFQADIEDVDRYEYSDLIKR